MLETAILQAAADELAESGYAGLTMDRVARRAGTNKNAIYRRWPNRAALCVAAYRRMLPTSPEETPDTGSLRSDALAVLNRGNARMSSPEGAILRGLLADLQSDPELIREVRGQLPGAGLGPWMTVLARAVARGEAGPGAMLPRVATVAVDLLRNEYAVHGITEVPPAILEEIVDQVFLPLVKAHS